MAGGIDGVNFDELVPQLVRSGEYSLEFRLNESPKHGTTSLTIAARPRIPSGAIHPQYALCFEGGWHIVQEGAEWPAFWVEDLGDQISQWLAGATQLKSVRDDLKAALAGAEDLRSRLAQAELDLRDERKACHLAIDLASRLEYHV